MTIRKICKMCAYEHSDCKGAKNAGTDNFCLYYKNPAVFNAREAAEQIQKLTEENERLKAQMTPAEFIKAKKAMCNFYDGATCSGCPLEKYTDCDMVDPVKLVEIVTKWANEKRRTNAEVTMEMLWKLLEDCDIECENIDVYEQKISEADNCIDVTIEISGINEEWWNSRTEGWK